MRRVRVAPPALIALGAVTLAVAALGAPVACAATDQTSLVSRANGTGGAASDQPSSESNVSRDGRYVVFTSGAANLGGDLDGGSLDVWRRDTVTGALVQVSTDALGDDATQGSISDDGCKISYTTDRAAVAADNELTEDVYVVDLCTLSGPVLASRNDGPAGTVAGDVSHSQISGDGDHVLFETTSVLTTDGGETDTNADSDLFVRELSSNNTYMVSQNAAGTSSATPGSFINQRKAISDDGSRVTFISAAADISAGDTDGNSDIYFRSGIGTGSETSARATLTSSEAEIPEPAILAGVISGNGDVIGFSVISPSLPGFTGFEQSYVRQISTGTTELVSEASGYDPADVANSPVLPDSLSDDGRFMIMTSYATNLTFANGPFDDVYLRDRANGTTVLLSRFTGATGTPAGQSREGRISGNGRYLSFESDRGLDPADANGNSDVYGRSLAEPAPPVKAKRVDVRPISGTPLVNTPGAGGFRPLRVAEQLPVGTLVNTKASRVALTTTSSTFKTQTADFYDGVFQIGQSGKGVQLVTLTLAGKLTGCSSKGKGKGKKGAKGKGKRSAAPGILARTVGAQASGAKGRKLWGRGKGKFRTKGKGGYATVRGTWWLTQDRCNDSTLFRVLTGVVAIDDFSKKGSVNKLLTHGTYVAHAKRK